MPEQQPPTREGKREPLADAVGRRAERRRRKRAQPERSAWFGLGMFGLVGWSVAVPTLAGIAVGVWLDQRWPGEVSWTLTGLLLGVVLGCLNAWVWIREERPDD